MLPAFSITKVKQSMQSENLKRYRATHYITSAHRLSQLPEDRGIEVVFSGRSNAGKSSAINTICDQRSLARVSRTPGRTQMINLFEVMPGRRIIDLPGYGYAKVPEHMKRHWQTTLESFFTTRQALKGLILIVDIRRRLEENDLLLLYWAQNRSVATHILLTKADKLKHGACTDALRHTQSALERQKIDASAQLFSSKTKYGLDKTHDVLNQMFEFDF